MNGEVVKRYRVVLGVEYCGTAYAGWQRQHHAATVQEHLERAVSRVANETVDVYCAGRTDAGVHGTGQVVHFDTSAKRDERAWVHGANTHLPEDVAVTWAAFVDTSFHARFTAVARRYRYVIWNHSLRPALLRHRVTWVYRPLNVEKMHCSAQYLLGEHDFSVFRSSACQAKTARREVTEIKVSRDREFIYIDIEANAFLHHMVRNIAGSLMEVGREEQPVSWLEALLQTRDRTQAGVTAPADGLYFVAVRYPDKYRLPGLEGRFLPRF